MLEICSVTVEKKWSVAEIFIMSNIGLYSFRIFATYTSAGQLLVQVSNKCRSVEARFKFPTKYT